MNSRQIIPILLSFILGILSAQYNIIAEQTAFSLLIASLLFVILLIVKKMHSYPAVYISFFFLGLLLMIQETNPLFSANHIKNIINGKSERMNIEGILYRSPERFLDRTRLYVDGERVFNKDSFSQIQGKIILTVEGVDAGIEYGDRIRFIAKMSEIRNFGNPGEFGYKWHLERQGIYARGFVENKRWIVNLGQDEKGNRLWANIEKIRNGLNDIIDKSASDESRGILKALLIGEDGEISKDARETFAKTGTAHILAISGMHIGIVAFAFYILIHKILIQSERLTLAFNIKKTAAILSIPPVVFYSLISGLSVSTQRALIMVIVFIIAISIDREKDLFNTLAIAAFLILIISPSAVYDISFQLSFASVFAIVYLVPKFQSLWEEDKTIDPLISPRRRTRDYILKILAMLSISIAASIGTAPIAAYHFHRVSIIGILANIIAVPLIGFIVASLELSAGLISIFSEGSGIFIFKTASLVLKISVWLIEIFSKISYSSIWVSTPTILEITTFYLLVVSIASFKRVRIARYSLAVLLILFLGDYLYWHYHVNYNKNIKVTFLSIGQGDSSLVELPHGKKMLIDGGGLRDSDFDAGERIIAPFLWKNKIKDIDYVVMTHPQSDHFKGLRFILENFNVKEFWWNNDNSQDEEYKDLMQIIENKNIKKRIMALDAIDINGARIESLNPLKPDMVTNKNNSSLVMKISYGDAEFLFTGDIEKEGEQALLEAKKDIKADVLKIPHHGSRTSSTEDFIKAVNPKIAVISLGYSNPFGFPHDDVVERYKKMDVNIMRTDLMGAITIETDGRGKTIKSYWQNTIVSPQTH